MTWAYLIVRDTWCSKEKLKFEEKNRVTMLFSLTVLSIGVSIAMCLCSGWSELKQNMLTKKLQQIKNPEIFIIKKESLEEARTLLGLTPNL